MNETFFSRPIDDPRGESVTQVDLCKLLGVNRSTVGDWRTQGLPVMPGDGRAIQYHVPSVLRWLFLREIGDDDDDPDQHSRLARVKADQIELQTAKLRGELLEAGEIEPGWTRLTMAFRDHVLRIPNVAEDLIGCDRHEMRAKIEERCRSALFELANVPINEDGATPQC